MFEPTDGLSDTTTQNVLILPDVGGRQTDWTFKPLWLKDRGTTSKWLGHFSEQSLCIQKRGLSEFLCNSHVSLKFQGASSLEKTHVALVGPELGWNNALFRHSFHVYIDVQVLWPKIGTAWPKTPKRKQDQCPAVFKIPK